ncbi:MAG: hypothetical protein ABJD53_15500, partial [Gammaproteobacteria bacterium]
LMNVRRTSRSREAFSGPDRNLAKMRFFRYDGAGAFLGVQQLTRNSGYFRRRRRIRGCSGGPGALAGFNQRSPMGLPLG